MLEHGLGIMASPLGNVHDRVPAAWRPVRAYPVRDTRCSHIVERTVPPRNSGLGAEFLQRGSRVRV